jgi:hypothetical protein
LTLYVLKETPVPFERKIEGDAMDMLNIGARQWAGIAIAVGLAGAIPLSAASAAPPADTVEAQAQETWRDTIVRTPVPDEGCFHASYPGTVWTKVACTTAPNRPFLPRSGLHSVGQTVGDGNDYAAEVSGLISESIGTFPTVTGVTSEKDEGEKNDYSLQLNSNFMSTAACNGISGCQSWEQFVYSTGERQAFMQYWLINYGKCPKGWNVSTPDCYKNSAAVAAPKIAITELQYLKISGTAVTNGNDTLVFTSETEAYSTTGEDSVVDLATDWHESEFNVIGDGGGSEAKFNKGASITVNIEVVDGSSAAPTCAADSGTTGETNNLTLKSCSASGGSAPSIKFIESD